MKFTTAFYTLALSFAAVTGSANARIGQQMSTDAFESRMMSGTQDCGGDGCCGGLICDPNSATACGNGKAQCGFITCDLQHPSGEYRCQPSGGRKLGGNPNNTPDSADARIGQQMSSNAFESRMMSGTEDCGDGCCGNNVCDPNSATACGRPKAQCQFITCTLQTPSGEYRCQS